MSEQQAQAISDLSMQQHGENGASHEEVQSALEGLVDHPDLHVFHPADHVVKHPWLAKIEQKLAPSAESLAAREHVGNFVIERSTGKKVWEPMPIYVRLGMHLLFVTGGYFTSSKRVEALLSAQTIKQGKIFDSEEGAQEHIAEFIKTYDLAGSLDTLLKPDPKDYKTFNEFFSRALKPGARIIASPDDPAVITSSADCRLVVFEELEPAKKIWIKGREFDLAHLIQDDSLTGQPGFKDGAAVAVFRLAPADYHRWHSPVAGRMGPIKHVAGTFFTVNPQAVNSPLPVFTENRRDVCPISVPRPEGGAPRVVITCAIGAMMVGSITWLAKEGDDVAKGSPQGLFQYGGSSVIAVFERGTVDFDADLLANSRAAIETQVRVGERIGRFV